jgi:catalase
MNTPAADSVRPIRPARVGGTAKHIQEGHIANCTKAHPAYDVGVAEAIAHLG